MPDSDLILAQMVAASIGSSEYDLEGQVAILSPLFKTESVEF